MYAPGPRQVHESSLRFKENTVPKIHGIKVEVASNERFTPEPEQANLYHVAHNLIRIEVSDVVDALDQVKSFLQTCCFQKPVCQILQVHENMIENVLDMAILRNFSD